MNKFKIVINILLVTSVIGLAISYITQLLDVIPDLNFLEAVGVYCIWTPIHHAFISTTSENESQYMNTLWTFGDSLTAPFDKKYKWSSDYINWKGYTPKVYSDIISEKLGYSLKNLGVGGYDNYSIFQTFCDVSHKIKENDLVIIGWSCPIRFRLVDSNNNWMTILPDFLNRHLQFKNITEETLSQIIVNRDNYRFVDEVNSWIFLIKNLITNTNIIHWTGFDKRLNSIYISNIERIKDETNNLINDAHFSEKGQLQLSQTIIDYYNTDRTKKIKII